MPVHWNLSQKHRQSRRDVYNGRPWANQSYSVGCRAALSSANVLVVSVWVVLCWPGWATKALKGCRNIMSSQQGQTLARKSLSCPFALLAYIFILMKANVTLSTIANALSHSWRMCRNTCLSVNVFTKISNEWSHSISLAWLEFPFISSWHASEACLERKEMIHHFSSEGIILHSVWVWWW